MGKVNGNDHRRDEIDDDDNHVSTTSTRTRSTFRLQNQQSLRKTHCYDIGLTAFAVIAVLSGIFLLSDRTDNNSLARDHRHYYDDYSRSSGISSLDMKTMQEALYGAGKEPQNVDPTIPKKNKKTLDSSSLRNPSMSVGVQNDSPNQMVAGSGAASNSTSVAAASQSPGTTKTKSKPLKRIPPHPYVERPPLEFVHIPKTGGTTIESRAAAKGVVWGRCHYVVQSAGTPCPSQGRFFLYPDYLNYTRNAPRPYNQNEWAPFWHIPPKYIRKYSALSTNGTDQTIVATTADHSPVWFRNMTLVYPPDVPLFAVVRNPYDRIISEYYYVMEKVRHTPVDVINMVSQMNRFLELSLQTVAKSQAPSISSKTTTITATSLMTMTKRNGYFEKDGHFIPQYDYIYDDDGTSTTTTKTTTATRTPSSVAVVQHVLKFENLTAEFNALMNLYQMGYLQLLDQTNATHHENESHDKLLSIHNVSQTNLELIHQIYHKDFITFGYPMMETPV